MTDECSHPDHMDLECVCHCTRCADPRIERGGARLLHLPAVHRVPSTRGERMSARDELIDAINSYDQTACYWPCATPCTPRCPTAEQMLDAYAHELAEKIRASTREGYGDPNPNTTYYEGDAAMGAANLIDPEVSDG